MEVSGRSLIKVLSRHLPAGSEGHQSALRTDSVLGEIQTGCLLSMSQVCYHCANLLSAIVSHPHLTHSPTAPMHPENVKQSDKSHGTPFLRVYTIEHKYEQTVTEPLYFVKTVGMFKLRQEHNLHRCHVLNGMGTYCSYCTMEKNYTGIRVQMMVDCLPERWT